MSPIIDREICENGLMTPTIEEIRAVPKVLLHDHLDGGLRAATVVDLAREIGTTGCRPRTWTRSRAGCAAARTAAT